MSVITQLKLYFSLTVAPSEPFFFFLKFLPPSPSGSSYGIVQRMELKSIYSQHRDDCPAWKRHWGWLWKWCGSGIQQNVPNRIPPFGKGAAPLSVTYLQKEIPLETQWKPHHPSLLQLHFPYSILENRSQRVAPKLQFIQKEKLCRLAALPRHCQNNPPASRAG